MGGYLDMQRNTGREPCRRAFHAAARAWALDELAAGRVTVGDFKNGLHALALTDADDASFVIDQPSKARAQRHWAAEIIALGHADRVRKRAIVITASCFMTSA
jgi:hypothetical protein